MKFKRFIVLLLLALSLFTMASCNNKTYNIEDYIIKLDYKSDFKLLVLADIHIANKDDRYRQYQFLDETIKIANADMIIVVGDLFTFADKIVAKELFDFFDSYKTPWTVCFGNHDEQCYFSVDWLTSYLNKLSKSDDSYCQFIDHQDDDVFGNSNFAINLMDGGTIKEQLIFIDSNRYNYGEYFGYDYIHQDQIDWYERLVKYTTSINGSVVQSMLFFHIPLPEWQTAWNLYEDGSPEVEYIMGECRENVCCPDVNSGFFDKICELNSTKSIIVGHDHLNNFILKYKGIDLCYTVTSTDRIYFEEDILGGMTVTIKDDHSLVYNQIIRSYDEYQ